MAGGAAGQAKGGGDGGNRTNIADRGCDDSECITAICPDSNAAGQTTNRNGDKNILSGIICKQFFRYMISPY